MKSALVIEDDHLQAEALMSFLTGTYPGLKVRCVATELDFRTNVIKEEPFPYSVAVVDMMLRWTDASPNIVMPPDEILQEGFFVAGLRCCRMLRQRRIPCVIFTALDPAKIPLRLEEQKDIPIVNKSRGFGALQPYLKQLAS